MNDSLVPKIAVRPCPITGSRQVALLHHQRFCLAEGNPLPDACDVVWSPQAGLAYADTPASQTVYDAYYARLSKYEDDTTGTGGGASPTDAARLEQTAAEIARVVPDRRARVVDVGCANGGLLLALRRLGYESLAGVDPSPACVRTVRERHGIAAAIGGLFDLPPVARPADMILLSHVLEHVVDLGTAVRRLAAALPAGGLVYAEVPDAARYHEFLFAPFQDFNSEHINHFGSAALANLFGRHGFAPETCGCRTIESSPGHAYPVRYGFFRRLAGRKPVTFPLQPDEPLLAALQTYIARSRAGLARIEARIQPLRAAGTPLVVWGTGQLTCKLLAETSLRSANIVRFVDGNPVNQGKQLCGQPIHAPRSLSRLPADNVILVATLLHQAAITHTIRDELGLPNRIVLLE